MIRSVSAIVVLALSVFASGCGASSGVAPASDVDLANGKTVFIAKCGACHTLAEAGTQGQIGPNLDDAYVGPRLSGFEQSSMEALVRQQMKSPIRSVRCPRNIVTGSDAADVSAYVALGRGRRTGQAAAERERHQRPRVNKRSQAPFIHSTHRCRG